MLRIGCGASGTLILILLAVAYLRFRTDVARRVSLEAQLMQTNTQLEVGAVKPREGTGLGLYVSGRPGSLDWRAC